MAIVFETNEELLRACVDDELTIYTVAEYQQELAKQWHESLALELDLSKVGELDSAGTQWLMQIKRTGYGRQQSVRFVDHSQMVIETLELLNLIGRFGDPVVLPASVIGSHDG